MPFIAALPPFRDYLWVFHLYNDRFRVSGPDQVCARSSKGSRSSTREGVRLVFKAVAVGSLATCRECSRSAPCLTFKHGNSPRGYAVRCEGEVIGGQ